MTMTLSGSGTIGGLVAGGLPNATVQPSDLTTGAPSWDSSGNQTVTGNLLFNSGYGSSATAYGCRAWVNFNGTGTVAIRASGNVSSITDNGTGDYTVNFTTAMPDANYSCTATSSWDSGARPGWIGVKQDTAPTTTEIRLLQMRPNDYVAQDTYYANVSVFR